MHSPGLSESPLMPGPAVLALGTDLVPNSLPVAPPSEGLTSRANYSLLSALSACHLSMPPVKSLSYKRVSAAVSILVTCVVGLLQMGARSQVEPELTHNPNT